jgi:hypothetical protein
MILDPKEIGWSILSEERDPEIYGRLTIVPRGAKPINLPDTIDRMYWPTNEWPKKTYNEIGIFHVVERVKDLVEFWKHLYEISAHGAFIKIYGTYWNHEDALADPTCLRGINTKMLFYISATGRKRLESDHYDDGVACSLLADVDFDLKSITHISEPLWEGKSDYERDYFITHYVNVAKKMEASLMCHKPVRTFDK